MEKNHIISEVRKNREKLSGQFNNDLDKLFDHFKKEEKKSRSNDIRLEICDFRYALTSALF